MDILLCTLSICILKSLRKSSCLPFFGILDQTLLRIWDFSCNARRGKTWKIRVVLRPSFAWHIHRALAQVLFLSGWHLANADLIHLQKLVWKPLNYEPMATTAILVACCNYTLTCNYWLDSKKVVVGHRWNMVKQCISTLIPGGFMSTPPVGPPMGLRPPTSTRGTQQQRRQSETVQRSAEPDQGTAAAVSKHVFIHFPKGRPNLLWFILYGKKWQC